MIHKKFSPENTRFVIIIKMAIIGLAFFAVVRAILLIRTWPLMDHSLSELIYIFGQGFIYDIAFIGYFCIPFVVLLLGLPNKWLNTPLFKLLTQATGFCILYGFYFSAICEWFFWNEFGVRFNFISVDYLVYRREVTDNILQSYPVFWILPILFFLSTLLFFWYDLPLKMHWQSRKNFLNGLVLPSACF